MSSFTYHFTNVVKYAQILAKKRGADEEVVVVAGWLHDIGSIHKDYKNHHISGAETAGQFLKAKGYPEEKIANVKHCINAHRGSKSIPRETKEAMCIADADAMSHFDSIGSLFRLALISLKLPEAEANVYVYEKLKRSWNKLTPEAKEIIKPRYDAAMIILQPPK
jgi:uncharacterized protein